MRRSDLASPGPARALVVAVAAALVVVAGAALLAGGDDGGELSADQAVEFTERALDEVGVVGQVGTPEKGSFRDGDRAEAVWVVPVVVGERQITLSVDADGDRALNLADQLADGTNVLTDEQFDALARFRDDPSASAPPPLASGAAVVTAAAASVAVGAAVRTGRATVPAL